MTRDGAASWAAVFLVLGLLAALVAGMRDEKPTCAYVYKLGAKPCQVQR